MGRRLAQCELLNKNLDMEAEQILKRIGYDNNSITVTEMWIAKEVYRLAMEDAAALCQPLVSGSFPCHHNFIQKDTYWKSCTHCGMIAPLGQ